MSVIKKCYNIGANSTFVELTYSKNVPTTEIIVVYNQTVMDTVLNQVNCIIKKIHERNSNVVIYPEKLILKDNATFIDIITKLETYKIPNNSRVTVISYEDSHCETDKSLFEIFKNNNVIELRCIEFLFGTSDIRYSHRKSSPFELSSTNISLQEVIQK